MDCWGWPVSLFHFNLLTQTLVLLGYVNTSQILFKMELLSFNFDIDLYLNRVVPRFRLHQLPKPISWLLGYREEPITPVGSIMVWFWGFIGAFVGILVIEAIFRTEQLRSYGSPVIIGSFVKPLSSLNLQDSTNKVISGSSSNP